MSSKYIYALLLASTALVLSSCENKTKEQEQQIVTNVDQDKKIDVYSAYELQPFYKVTLPGELLADNSVDLYPKVSGHIDKLYVEIGQQVKKGQVLAVLQAPEVSNAMSDATFISDQKRVDYTLAKNNYERFVNAAQTPGAVSQWELDHSKAAMEAAKATLNSSIAKQAQQTQLHNYLRITAPFDGVITHKYLAEGELVQPNAQGKIYTIAQNDQLRLKVGLAQKHASAVGDSTKATFTLSSDPYVKHHVVLSRHSNALDVMNRSLALEFDIDNSNQEYLVGDYATVELQLQRKQPTLWVKPSSVVQAQDGVFVLALDQQNKPKRIAVEIGTKLDTIVEVFGELTTKQQILVKGYE